MRKLTALILLVTISSAAAQTVGWRTDGTGMYPDAKIPLTWSTTQNVVYSQALPKWGNATPVISGAKMFFCAEPNVLICADVKTGAILWQKENPSPPPLPKRHKTNGYSSPTPVTNGSVVAVVFGTGITAVYDMEGNLKWSRVIQRPVQKQGWGHCASPALVGDTLIVSITDVFGLDVATGEQKWRVASKAHWGSPFTTTIGGTPVIVTANGEVIRPSDGKVLTADLGALPWTSPMVYKGVIYFIDQKGGKAIKLPARISDDMKFEVLWQSTPKSDRYYASAVVYDGKIFVVTQAGVLSVINITDGKVLAEHTLTFPKVRGKRLYSSIVLAGDKLLISHEIGITLVLAATVECTELARNTLEPFRSTPVCVGSRMYIRGLKNLYCIGE